MAFVGDNNNKIVNDYVFLLVKDDVKKFIKFLTHHRKKAMIDKQIFNLDEIAQVYNIEELQKLAEKFKDDTSLTNEEKNIIELFLKLYQEYEVKESP